jgi:hypothetical protein
MSKKNRGREESKDSMIMANRRLYGLVSPVRGLYKNDLHSVKLPPVLN